MPYCTQCGKLITTVILMKNDGDCNECVQKEAPEDLQLKQPSPKTPRRFIKISWWRIIVPIIVFLIFVFLIGILFNDPSYCKYCYVD